MDQRDCAVWAIIVYYQETCSILVTLPWSWVLLPLESMGLVLVTPEKQDSACGAEPPPAKVQGEASEYRGNSLILNDI